MSGGADVVDVWRGLSEHEVPGALREALEQLPLVDHHVHGTYQATLGRPDFEAALNEASTGEVPAFMTMFDSQLGVAVRRWVGPLLGLSGPVGAEAYWRERAALDAEQLDDRLLSRSGVAHWVVDPGHGAGTVGSHRDLARRSGASSSTLVRLEVLVEQVAAQECSPTSFASSFRSALAAQTSGPDAVVGAKSIAAYRTGLDIDWTRPADADVCAAVERWWDKARSAGEADLRMDDPVLVAFVVHEALALGLPLQFHTGFGDRDMDLDRGNPLHLLPLLRAGVPDSTPVLLLHCWPYHREAGWLAQAFDHVHFDIGLGITHLGANSVHLVREALELAPFAKQLYSSDAYGLPELHVLGPLLWRRAMGRVLGEWVTREEWTIRDAVRAATMIGVDNARRVYDL
jgi:predicted TIM-barrel fold metal-dependent hydrolase